MCCPVFINNYFIRLTRANKKQWWTSIAVSWIHYYLQPTIELNVRCSQFILWWCFTIYISDLIFCYSFRILKKYVPCLKYRVRFFSEYYKYVWTQAPSLYPPVPTVLLLWLHLNLLILSIEFFCLLLSSICLFFIKLCCRLLGCSGVQSDDKQTLDLVFLLLVGIIFKILFDMISRFVVKWMGE